MHRKSRLIPILKLLNKLEKKRWNARLAKNFVTFCDKRNKFNNTGARLTGSIYCMTLKLLLNSV